jgi:hypothetical protein
MWHGLYLDTIEFGYGALYQLYTTLFTGRGAVRSRAVTILREPEAKPATSDSFFTKSQSSISWKLSAERPLPA